MIRFAHPEYLYSLIAVPLLLLLYIWTASSRERALRSFGNPILLQRLMPDGGKNRRMFKFLLTLAAISLVAVALANPQVGTKLETLKREGVDVLIALDISNSMNAEDFKPTRLENAKRQISMMLQRLQNDRIGIVVFAGSAFLQLPLTTDYGAAQLILSSVDAGFIPVQGTAIGSAIRMAKESFVRGETKHRVIIVISDGEDFEEDALSAAKEASGDGIVIHAVGMGSPRGVPIPVYQNGTPAGFKKDSKGNVVITKLNEALLQQLADAGKGRYIAAGNNQNELEAIFKDIEGMEKKELATRVYTEFEDRYQYPLSAALSLLLIEFLISERKGRWSMRWKALLPGGARAASLLLLLMTAFCSPLQAESDRSFVREGNRLYDSRKYDEAEVSYRKALEKNQKMREGQFNLGDTLYQQGRFEEAEQQFRQSAEAAADPLARSQAYHNLGNALLKSKKLEDSIRAYKDALKLNPQDQDTKYNLEYAQRLLQQQQQQQQQNKDQNKDNKDQENKPEQQEEQKKDENQQDQKQQQQQQDQKQEEQKKQDEQQQKQQQPDEQQQQGERQKKKQQISQQDAERILQALKNEEKNVQKKLRKSSAKKVAVEKDW